MASRCAVTDLHVAEETRLAEPLPRDCRINLPAFRQHVTLYIHSMFMRYILTNILVNYIWISVTKIYSDIVALQMEEDLKVILQSNRMLKI
jgi:hypothetical protein